MTTLTFKDIAGLLNLSRSIELNPEPVDRAAGKWTLYTGSYILPFHKDTFRVLWLDRGASAVAVEEALEKHKGDRTHIIYPQTDGQRHFKVIQRLQREDRSFTPKAYIRRHLGELDQYVQQVSQEPQYYIDPHLETPRQPSTRLPNAVEAFLVEPSWNGTVGVLLADPGQGKTYLTRYVAHRLATKADLVPILVESSQWSSMQAEDLADLAKTVVHSFRFHGAPIPWAEGQEAAFLHAALKADLFRIVFDGFDEYVLRNREYVEPAAVMGSLRQLAEEAGTPVVITSRTSFWESNLPEEQRERFVSETGVHVFRILPFNVERARKYFTARLSDERAVEHAIQIFRTLQRTRSDERLVGRGFVLALIADLIDAGHNPGTFTADAASPLLWLMQAFCRRETQRMSLPISADEQMTMLQTFVGETAAPGAVRDDAMMEWSLELSKSDLTPEQIRYCLKALRDHPLLSYNEEHGTWGFRQEQVGNVLLALYINSQTPEQFVRFAREIAFEAESIQDLASTLVALNADDAVNEANEAADTSSAVSRLGYLVRSLTAAAGDESVSGSRLLATRLALATIDDRLRGQGTRLERAELLRDLSGDDSIRGYYFKDNFTGNIASFDFTNSVFHGCRFDHVSFANCRFDTTTRFVGCTISGDIQIHNSDGFRSTSIPTEGEMTNTLDSDASRWLQNMQVTENLRSYTDQNLMDDIGRYLDRFISKGGTSLKTVKERDLNRGAIRSSPHRQKILTALMTHVLETHTISGISDKGMNVRPDAAESVRFYAINNSFTGPVRVAYESLKGLVDG